MDCKNCKTELEKDAQFCNYCGAKVIKNRITFQELITLFVIDVFGVDSKFFRTMKEMALHPDRVLQEYITGVRKRYVNPFAFLAVGAALSLLIYNYFADDYVKFQQSINSEQLIEIEKKANIDLEKFKDLPDKDFKKLKFEKQTAETQLKFMSTLNKFTLQYFNLFAFLFLIIYASLSKWTYPKPHNFGEHIVMNAYIYGFATYFSIIAFFLALLIHPSIYGYSLLTYFVYYLYCFGKLYKHSFGKSLVKLLRFLLGLAVIFLVFTFIGGVLAAFFFMGGVNPT